MEAEILEKEDTIRTMDTESPKRFPPSIILGFAMFDPRFRVSQVGSTLGWEFSFAVLSRHESEKKLRKL